MSINRLTDVIIAKNVAPGTDGGIQVVSMTGTALTAGQTVADYPIIKIEQTLATTANRLYSMPIHGQFVRNWTGKAKADATKQRTDVGSINAVSDQEYGLYISVNSDKELSQGNRRFYVQYFSDSSATVAEIVAGIVAAGNAASSGLDGRVTFTDVSSTTIRIDADYANVYFTVGKAIGFDSSVTISTTTNSDPGVGTYDQVLALEEIAKGYQGYLGERRTFVGNLPGFSRPTYYAAGTAGTVTGVYDMYVIDHDQPWDEQGANNLERKPIQTIICYPAAATTNQSNFESVINPWMASTPGAFAAVNF